MRNALNKIKNAANFNSENSTTDANLNKLVSHARNELNNDNAGVGYIADDTSEQILKKSTKNLIEQSNIYKLSLKEMFLLQAQIIEETKTLTSKSKDYANQVGDAMARIDKVIVKDFDRKLELLERFVTAMQTLDELKKNGRLDEISKSFIR